MYDDFEDAPLKWTPSPVSTGVANRIAGAACNGSFGLEICAQKVGAIPGNNQTRKHTPLGERKTLELAVYWRVPTTPVNAVFTFMIRQWIGIREARAAIRYVYNPAIPTVEWQLYAAGIWTPLAGSELPNFGAWHEIVIAADFATERYMYARSNSTVFPICEQETGRIVAAAGEENRVEIRVEEYNTDLVCMHVDDVLLKEL